MKQFFITLLIILCCFSCNNKQQYKPDENVQTSEKDSTTNLSESFLPDSTLLSITGDWNGDGIEERLTECYFSKRLNKSVIAPCFSDTIEDFMDMVGEAVKLDPRVYLISENNKLDTLIVSNYEYYQTFGIAYLKNMGDMDGDRCEELGYVEHLAQMSSLTTFHIAKYKNNKWTELFSFPTWSWANLDSLVVKTGNMKYEINYRGQYADEEKMILDFKETPHPKSLPFFIENKEDE